MNPVRNNEQNMSNQNKTRYCVSSISNGMKKTSLILIIPFLSLVMGMASMVPAAHATVGADCSQDNSVCDSYSETCDLQTFKCVPIGDSGVLQPATTPTQTAPTSGFVPLAPIPGLTDIQPTPNGLADFFNNLYKYIIGLAAILAIIEIIWGGLEISTKDSVSKQSDGKERITQAIFGLVLVLSPVLVFSIINPSILNLSLNLPPLDTKAGTPTGNGITPRQTVINNAARAEGCNVVGTTLKTAYCPTQEAAQQFAVKCSTGTGKVLSSQSSVGPCAAWQQTEKIDAYTTAIGGTPNCTTYPATCTAVAGSFVFLDTSTSFSLALFSDYQPLTSSGGESLVSFASSCVQDEGMVCLKPDVISTSCSSYTSQPSLIGKKCYNTLVSCENKALIFPARFLCSTLPSWKPVN